MKINKEIPYIYNSTYNKIFYGEEIFNKSRNFFEYGYNKIDYTINICEEHLPILVSYPRSGSHYLRLLLESYSRRPIVPVSYYQHDNEDFIVGAIHDMELIYKPKSVIYLWRKDIVECIFSMLYFDNYDIDKDRPHFLRFVTSYCCNFLKWVKFSNFCEKKTIIKYENLL